MSTELIPIPKPIPTQFIKGEVATELTTSELNTFGQFLHTITPLVRQSNDIGGEVKFMLEMCLGDNELIGPFKSKREASEMYPDTQVLKVAK